jgi:LysM repeat protein
MKSWKGLALFLVLNVLVSVCATLTVLVIWDRNRGAQQEGGLQGSLLPLLDLRSTPEETVLPTNTVPVEALATPTQAFQAYEVKAGDDFSSIAEKFGISVEELISINGFTVDQPLGAGEILQIPYQPTAVPEGVVVIKNVVGAGDLNTERVLLKFTGEGELSMVGWRLEDQDGNRFEFSQSPALTLFTDGAVYIFTKPGVNSVIEQFWGKDQPVWQSGEVVTLLDAEGKVRSNYTIP